MTTDKLTEDMPQTEAELAKGQPQSRLLTEDLPQEEDEDEGPGLLTEDL